jgi:hypothetical protein
MSYNGQTGEIKELGIYVMTSKDGVAHFWCEQHGCTAVWNDAMQAFVVEGRNGELIKTKEQPCSPPDGSTPAYTMGDQVIYRDKDNPNVLWGAMWWA